MVKGMLFSSNDIRTEESLTQMLEVETFQKQNSVGALVDKREKKKKKHAASIRLSPGIE